jgi:hypothetical protein
MAGYVITVRSEGGGPPVEVRLRRALKALLRGFGLRCIEVRPVENTRPARSDALEGAKAGRASSRGSKTA